jgi:transposase
MPGVIWRRRGERSGGSRTSWGFHPEALRNWVRQGEVDGGVRAGTTTDDTTRIAALEREVRELRRANDILKTSAAAELDRKIK